jgi:hypothetical protein
MSPSFWGVRSQQLSFLGSLLASNYKIATKLSCNYDTVITSVAKLSIHKYVSELNTLKHIF